MPGRTVRSLLVLLVVLIATTVVVVHRAADTSAATSQGFYLDIGASSSLGTQRPFSRLVVAVRNPSLLASECRGPFEVIAPVGAEWRHAHRGAVAPRTLSAVSRFHDGTPGMTQSHAVQQLTREVPVAALNI